MCRSASVDLGVELSWVRLLVCQDAERHLRDELKRLGYSVVTVRGANISDEASMFKELSIALSLGVHDAHDWNSFLQLFGESMLKSKRPIAMLWQDASTTIEKCLGNFLVAVHHLTNQTESAYRVRDKAVKFEVVFLGRGPGFDAMPTK